LIGDRAQCRILLNTGPGDTGSHTCVELLAAGRAVPYRIVARRPGDVAVNYSDPSKAARGFGWRATRDLDAMCRDAWRWQQWQAEHAAEL